MQKFFLSLLITVLLLSCKNIGPDKPADKGKIEAGVYHNETIGWTITIPEGWKITAQDQVEEQTRTGLDAIQEATDMEYDYSGLIHLLNFEKDQTHSFQSSLEPFELQYEGEWEENSQLVKELMHETYASRGILVDTTSSKENIGGLEFDVFHLTLYTPEGEVFLYQDMYARHYMGFDFGVNLNYLRTEEKNEMLQAWKNSEFK